MKKITRIATIITLTSTGLSVFALPTITVIHKAVPYQNQAGYLEIRVGAFKPCTFISSKPVKAGSVFSVNLNDIAKYKQLGKNCTQQQIQSKV
ncbi:MAG: hypothetical protein NTU49_09910, partial [Gammaproteobacteria bacterium]|nr:hypothetical protein [Gammaproteobacteria bacterium]